jgi:hypothetical protein
MTKAKTRRPRPAPAGGKPENPEKLRKGSEAGLKPAPKERLANQTRKLLGKHYANKYRTGRGG